MLEDITVIDILGRVFFCECGEPDLRDCVQVREMPLSEEYGHRMFTYKRCKKCGRTPVPKDKDSPE